MRDIVMYSGGKESLLTLKDSVDEGQDPAIIHIRTKKLSDNHERIVKRNAMRIHPTDAYYVYETDTDSYYAYWAPDTLEYGYSQEGHPDTELTNHMRLDQLGNLHIGYWTRDNGSTRHFIRDVKHHPRGEHKYTLPLADHTKKQILTQWRQLPKQVREDTYSSTITNFRQWTGEGHSVPTIKHLEEQQ